MVGAEQFVQPGLHLVMHWRDRWQAERGDEGADFQRARQGHALGKHPAQHRKTDALALRRELAQELAASGTATSTTWVSESKFMSQTCSASTVRERICPRLRSSSTNRLNSLVVR